MRDGVSGDLKCNHGKDKIEEKWENADACRIRGWHTCSKIRQSSSMIENSEACV